MPAYLVRHAHAGSRSSWDGGDARRPLSPKGRQQAMGLLELLDGVRLDRVASSTATRCVETVEPMARAAGLVVEADPRLAEGADVDGCIEAVLAAGDKHVVLCTHGDLIPKVIRRLRAEGMVSTDPNLSQKGSVWILDVLDGRVISGSYEPPTRP